jgi:hypothetical protein
MCFVGLGIRVYYVFCQAWYKYLNAARQTQGVSHKTLATRIIATRIKVMMLLNRLLGVSLILLVGVSQLPT